MKAVQRELAEEFRQPRQLFDAGGRVRQIAGKDLRQLPGKVTQKLGAATVPYRAATNGAAAHARSVKRPRGPGPDKYEEDICNTGG
jgi:hypothetical protein